MKENPTPQELPDQEQIRKMLSALWPDLQETLAPSETQSPLSSPQNPADILNESEIDELLSAIEPSDKEDVLSTAEIEQVLNALAQERPGSAEPAAASEEQSASGNLGSPSPAQTKPPLNEEETKLLLKTIGAIKQAGAPPPGSEHHAPLTEEEVEKLVQALSQEDK